MKVKYAAQVLSLTVAQLLENLNWENTSETVEFIRRVNNFFDMLNGAHSQQGKRTRNKNLDPYCSADDPRFQELDDFLNYLNEWKEEAELSTNQTIDPTLNASMAHNPDELEDILQDEEEDPDEWKDPASIRQLSKQTLEGIEITVGGFKAAVKFLLSEGTKFVNARCFCQDPLEQFFSKLRSRGGGSNNPNFSQTLHSQRSIHLQGQVGKKRNFSGNTEEEAQAMQISDAPLPRKTYKRAKKN